jgi:uncharacterized protein (TIGR00730 family)
MGSVADGALQARGHVIGVVPEYLNQPQLIHSSLSQLEIVTDIHLRKARMSALADAFIALPGGFGTLEELFEALAAAQTGLHQKPIALLNINHYYDPLISFIDQASRQRFIYPEHRQLLLVDDSANGVFEKLEKYTTPKNLERWINR